MSDKRYLGNIITDTPTEPTENYANSAASGVWSLAEAERYTAAGLWPNAANLAPTAFFNTGSSNINLEKVLIGSLGNTTDFGDMTLKEGRSGISSSTRGIFTSIPLPNPLFLLEIVIVICLGEICL